LTIDPTTDSLQDVAAALSAIDHLQAAVDSQTGTLQIWADPGFAFDFAGRLDPTPDPSAITGSARPAISGRFSGSANAAWTFDVVGSGSVGVTPGLTVEVRDAAGSLLASLDVGRGYEAGTGLTIADGVQVAFSAGTLNAGDAFAITAVAQPDTSHLLVALGLNTFFAGTDASSIAVHPLLLQAPELLAVARSGQSGDVDNLLRLIAARDTKLATLSAQTPEEFLAWTTGTVGDRVRSAELVFDQVELLGQQLDAERSSYSAVDPNEEMVRLVQLQQAFQAAAKLITVANETMAELLQTIR
jgi:flagellar hook-associated protein FlgK